MPGFLKLDQTIDTKQEVYAGLSGRVFDPKLRGTATGAWERWPSLLTGRSRTQRGKAVVRPTSVLGHLFWPWP